MNAIPDSVLVLFFVLSVATAGAAIVRAIWSAWEHQCADVRYHLDETDYCDCCGCGMVNSATGWKCPECRNQVEA